MCCSVQSLYRFGSRDGHDRRFSRDPLPVFSAGGHCEQLWHGKEWPLFDVVCPALPLPTTSSPTLQDALKYGFVEAVMTCDLLEPCKFPSLDSCQKKFLWTQKEVDLVPHPVIGLVFQVGDAENFPQALGFKSLDPFFSSEPAKRVPVSRPRRRIEVTRDLYNLNLPAKLMVLLCQFLFNPAIAAIAEAICGFLLSRCHPCAGCGVRAVGRGLALFCAYLHAVYAFALSTSLLVRS